MLIGIERSETADPDSIDKDAMLLNCYLRHEGNLMVCIPISVEADSRVRVQLWDGMQFPINFTALVTMNRTRCSSLNSGNCPIATQKRLAQVTNQVLKQIRSTP